MAQVHLNASLRDLTGGVAEVEVDASTVRRLIAALDERFPGLGERLSERTAVSWLGVRMLYSSISRLA